MSIERFYNSVWQAIMDWIDIETFDDVGVLTKIFENNSYSKIKNKML